ncbi:MAG: ABC transporter ATP-binding protein [Propionibacteriaceae bacterium]
MTTVAASARGLNKIYGTGDAQVIALDNVDIDIGAGEFTAVMGPSGSGKSTLMHCLSGLDQPSGGHVFIGETGLGHLKDTQLTKLRRTAVGFIFQSFNLIPSLSAQENILLPLAIAGKKPDPAWYEQVISAVGLGNRLQHKPPQLSGGQQQRVACARALMGKPTIVFADEPTGNLDSHASAEVLSFLRDSVDRFGQTIVMVTHDPVAASYADRAIFLADGKVVGDIANPTRESVLASMAHLDAAEASAMRAKAQLKDGVHSENVTSS